MQHLHLRPPILALLVVFNSSLFAEPVDRWEAVFDSRNSVCELTTLVTTPHSPGFEPAGFWFGFYFFVEDLKVELFDYSGGSTYLVLRFLLDPLMGKEEIPPVDVSVNGQSPVKTVDSESGSGIEFAFFDSDTSAEILDLLSRDGAAQVTLRFKDHENLTINLSGSGQSEFRVGHAMHSACISANVGQQGATLKPPGFRHGSCSGNNRAVSWSHQSLDVRWLFAFSSIWAHRNICVVRLQLFD